MIKMAGLQPPALIRQHVRKPNIITRIQNAIENQDLQREEILSRDICQQIQSGEKAFENGLGGLLTQLSGEDINFLYIRSGGNIYNLLQYAILINRPNWVRQLLYFGAITLPTSSNINYPNHGWGLYLDASQEIKDIFAEDEIMDIFGQNQIEHIQRVANEIDDRANQ